MLPVRNRLVRQSLFFISLRSFLENRLCGLAVTIRKRINRYHPEADLRLTDALLQELKDLSFALPAAFAQQLLRTWANGWTTSWRINEVSALDCIFGCAGEQDDLCHYLFCPVLWSAIWKLMVPPLLKTHFEF